jgi:hypothetical protein
MEIRIVSEKDFTSFDFPEDAGAGFSETSRLSTRLCGTTSNKATTLFVDLLSCVCLHWARDEFRVLKRDTGDFVFFFFFL